MRSWFFNYKMTYVCTYFFLCKINLPFFKWRLPMYMLSHFSHVQLFVTPWAVALQSPLSMGFSRQEYQSGLPFPPSSRVSSRPKDWTCVSCGSCITGGFFITWAPALRVDSLSLELLHCRWILYHLSSCIASGFFITWAHCCCCCC